MSPPVNKNIIIPSPLHNFHHYIITTSSALYLVHVLLEACQEFIAASQWLVISQTLVVVSIRSELRNHAVREHLCFILIGLQGQVGVHVVFWLGHSHLCVGYCMYVCSHLNQQLNSPHQLGQFGRNLVSLSSTSIQRPAGELPGLN